VTNDSAHGSVKGVVRALRLTSIASVLSIAFGVGTNKIIAVVAGPPGVALIGVYRTLVSIVTSLVQLGVSDRAMQKLSVARSDEEARQTIAAASALTLGQSLLVLLAALVAARPIARWIFGAAEAASHVWEVRFVLATTVGVLMLQTVTALLNGQVMLREAMRVSVATSAATFATVYPFLLLGNVGLAFVIGATCFVGAGLGLADLVRRNHLRASDLFSLHRWRHALRVLPLSASLTLEPLVVTGSGLILQSLMARGYGIDQLGLYNAAGLLEGTAVMVLTASMRSYFVPTLGRLEREGDKQAFINRVLMLLTLAVLAGVAVLVFVAPLAMRLLFSSRFVGASKLAAIVGVSIVGQLYGWCYSMYFLHRAQFRTRLVLETAWAVARVAATWYCIERGMSLSAVAWVHVGAHTFSGLIHAGVAVARGGRGMLSPLNLLLGVAGLAGLITLVLWRG
jgi:O-antigen/teichoic acid export membrane protein